jgi:hypothetical protein
VWREDNSERIECWDDRQTNDSAKRLLPPHLGSLQREMLTGSALFALDSRSEWSKVILYE